MASQEGLNTELESFRQQWLFDLRSRNDGPSRPSQAPPAQLPPTSNAANAGTTKSQPPAPRSPVANRRAATTQRDPEDEYFLSRTFDEPAPSAGSGAGPTLANPDAGRSVPEKELVSALDHYEEAMEKEASGNMGDSLRLYRKAYRLDHRVDKRYREKHHPVAPSKAPVPAATTATSSSPAEAAGAASASKPTGTTTNPDKEEPKPLSINELLASFASLKIKPADPAIEGDVPPPCPIASLPDELLTHILHDVAVDDVADFMRLSRVCRRLAYLVASEQRIWRRVALGDEVGFGGMHYHWKKGVEWEDLEEEADQLQNHQRADSEEDDDDYGTTLFLSKRELEDRRRGESLLITNSLLTSGTYRSWKQMFRSRPRLRFNGCYISTVNYVRSGQASTMSLTWNSPIHIVTYYRYLRFFRDGTAISLLHTSEPGDVVHHLTREALLLHRDKAHAYLPSAMMQSALKGRWRLSSALDLIHDRPDASPAEQEGDLYVETEGVGSKYTYRMDLSLQSAGRGARNNKFAWRGFYSYNKLTDDWAEFGLKNDKPFFFSRVKSYGKGA